jgi:hypothetical protein
MSVSAADRGSTSGALARRFHETGACPASAPGVVVLMQARATPFDFFRAPSPLDVQAAAFGAAEAGELDAVVRRVNAVAARWQELDGARGCVDDRICGVPPWVCCLPVICCLGGACALVAHTKRKIVGYTAEVTALLQEASSGGVQWALCSGAHVDQVDMTKVNLARGPGEGRASPGSIITTLVWLEARSAGVTTEGSSGAGRD